jgi:outer membrane protein OmpA-like peptidoglycan-associated protein
MKKIITLSLLILASQCLWAQDDEPRWGLSFGVDKDTTKWLIASPYDNWFLILGGGVQTFIGNELDASARHNKLNFNASAEVGKWIIPDLAFSLRYNFFNVDGQSRYGLQPFINYDEVPLDQRYDTANPGYYNYQPFHAHAMTLMGFFTLDWTNFLLGYEKGKRTQLHWVSPIGLGTSMLFGTQKNPLKHHEADPQPGDFRRNFELCYSVRFGAEYHTLRGFSLVAYMELFGSESTWDWSPYVDWWNIFDIIPSFNVGIKLDLLKHANKKDPRTQKNVREKVNHEFLPAIPLYRIDSLQNEIYRLIDNRDSILNMSDLQGRDDAHTIDSINNLLDSINNLLDQELDKQPTPDGDVTPTNVIDELIRANQVLNLPATIVYYQLDKYFLDYNAHMRLMEFAREARQINDTIEFYVIGAADSLTGSIRHNQWLSERRSEAAFNSLVNDYGLNPNRLIKKPAGGITEYRKKEQNRMAMIIQKTPITEEIVNRWMRRGKEVLKNAAPDSRDRNNSRVSDGYEE